jgi:tetratricopeptide (TPR) repeat protein
MCGGEKLMWRIVKCFTLLLGISLLGFDQIFSQNEIEIHNAKPGLVSKPTTNLNEGSIEPQYSINLGNILNAHFFPGLLDYSEGNYSSALGQMQYFIDRPQYTKNHPQHLKFLSIAHYICGMIHLYHDFGYRRYDHAKAHFEKSIHIDPGNHLAYLGISRLLSAVEQKDQAIYILQHLLDLKPKEDIAQQAKKELILLQSKKSK